MAFSIYLEITVFNSCPELAVLVDVCSLPCSLSPKILTTETFCLEKYSWHPHKKQVQKVYKIGKYNFCTVVSCSEIHCFELTILMLYHKLPGQLSGIELGYRLDDWWFKSWQKMGIFLFTTVSRLVLGPTQPPVQLVPGALSLGVKWPECEADHSPPSSAKVKECVALYLHSFPQYAFMVWCSVKKAQGQLHLYLLLYLSTPPDFSFALYKIKSTPLAVWKLLSPAFNEQEASK
jgi:hypothetical protein